MPKEHFIIKSVKLLNLSSIINSLDMKNQANNDTYNNT